MNVYTGEYRLFTGRGHGGDEAARRKTPVARRAEHSHATTTDRCDGVHNSSSADVELVLVAGSGTHRPRRRRSTPTAYRRSRHSYSPIMHVGVEHRPVCTYAGNTSDPVRRQNFSSPHCHAVGRRGRSEPDFDGLPRRRSLSTLSVSNTSEAKFAAVDLRRPRLRLRLRLRLLCLTA